MAVKAARETFGTPELIEVGKKDLWWLSCWYVHEESQPRLWNPCYSTTSLVVLHFEGEEIDYTRERLVRWEVREPVPGEGPTWQEAEGPTWQEVEGAEFLHRQMEEMRQRQREWDKMKHHQ
jgi:hypothetical protein